MKNQTLTNKRGAFDFKELALVRIKECERVQGEIIRFPKLFHKLCSSFSMKKCDIWLELRKLREIEIVPFHGVRFK